MHDEEKTREQLLEEIQEHRRSEEQLAIFKKFAEASGQGLAISHRTVEEHGGALTVTSTAGASTCFTMYLPF